MVAPNQDSAPPAPPMDAPPAQAAAPADSKPAAKAPEQAAPTGGFTGGSPQAAQRNINWITRIGSGDPQEKAKVMAEIKRANLSAADMQALREMGNYYGIKF